MSYVPTPDPLQGRVAVVTGAGRGIGSAAAQALDALGARVVLVSRTRRQLDAVAAELVNEPICVTADLSGLEGVGTVLETVRAETGGAQILVNNAGGHASVPSLDLPSQAWDMVQNVNVRAGFELARGLAPGMAKAGWGKIVNIASVLGLVGDGQSAAYVTSKAGLLGLTRALATEWGPLGIRVNALCPGWVDTELVSELTGNASFSRRVQRRTPLGRWATPDDLVGAVQFLCAPASDFMTGQALVVDGGLTATW